MSEWKPIETAPKDGTDVILLWKGSVEFGWYNVQRNPKFGEWSFYFSGSAAYSASNRDPNCPNPTHWMPLPDPPKE